MNSMMKSVILRFLRGLGAALIGTAIAYTVSFLTDAPDLLPPTILALATALILTLDKWWRSRE